MGDFRYLLSAEIPATSLRRVRDALRDEPLSLRDRIGSDELARQLDEFKLCVDLAFDEEWGELVADIEILSTYLPSPVIGTEIHAAAHSDPRGWRLLGRAGEVVRIALDVVRLPDGTIEVIGENEEQLRAQLATLPRWAQSLLAPRLKRPVAANG